jgi:hypothetical protein
MHGRQPELETTFRQRRQRGQIRGAARGGPVAGCWCQEPSVRARKSLRSAPNAKALALATCSYIYRRPSRGVAPKCRASDTKSIHGMYVYIAV